MDKKDGKVNKAIFDIHVIDVYFTSVYSNPPRYLILVQLLRVVTQKQELQDKQRLVKDEVTMCIGNDSKVDKITIAHSFYLRD